MPRTGSGWQPAPRVFGPARGRLALGAVGIGAGGGGFLFGWMLVSQGGRPSYGESPYPIAAPGWLPVVGWVLVAVAVLSLVAIHLSAPVSKGEPVPEHRRRPVDERMWPITSAMIVPFVAALITTSIAATKSSDRWEPLGAAFIFAFALPPLLFWLARKQW